MGQKVFSATLQARAFARENHMLDHHSVCKPVHNTCTCHSITPALLAQPGSQQHSPAWARAATPLLPKKCPRPTHTFPSAESSQAFGNQVGASKGKLRLPWPSLSTYIMEGPLATRQLPGQNTGTRPSGPMRASTSESHTRPSSCVAPSVGRPTSCLLSAGARTVARKARGPFQPPR